MVHLLAHPLQERGAARIAIERQRRTQEILGAIADGAKRRDQMPAVDFVLCHEHGVLLTLRQFAQTSFSKRICRLTAPCVIRSSSPALAKLPSLAAASKKRNVLSGTCLAACLAACLALISQFSLRISDRFDRFSFLLIISII
jgi:hypothetical protein